jgi:hypothetical protein
MSLKYQIKETAPFVEFTALSIDNAGGNPFDIIITSEINLHTYCLAIINKVFELKHSNLEAFITYQISLAKHPEKWLNKFEKLITLNEHLFDNTRNKTKLIKLFAILELQRQKMQSSSIKEVKPKTPPRLINATSEERHFSFHEVKNYVDTTEDFNAKVLYLNEEIFEYQQAEIISTNTKLQPYDVQCSKLLNKIQSIRKLKQELEKEKKELAQQSNPSLQPKIKLRINGATNILVNAFKQMMNKKGTNGKPYLHYNIKEVAEFICDSFVDEFGEPLSKATVQTYLSPNRIDKDPNNDDKIKL